MRRALPAIAATAGGLVLLANFQSSPEPTGLALSSSAPATTASLATAPPDPTPSTTSATVVSTTTTTTTTTPGNVITGPVAHNKWGDVQVRVTLSAGRIEDVQAVRLPGDNSHSVALSREAAPRLRTEVLRAQSADVDLVSGATLTSESYLASLQGALDTAGR